MDDGVTGFRSYADALWWGVVSSGLCRAVKCVEVLAWRAVIYISVVSSTLFPSQPSTVQHISVLVHL